MTKRVHVAISMQPEDQQALNAISEKLGMKPSEVVRGMIKKLQGDEVTQSIILNNFYNERKESLSKERLLRIMSIRTSRKKDGANSNHDAGSVSLSNQPKNSTYERVSQSTESFRKPEEMSPEELNRAIDEALKELEEESKERQKQEDLRVQEYLKRYGITKR